MAVVEIAGGSDLVANADPEAGAAAGGEDLDRQAQQIRMDSNGLHQGPILRPHRDPALYHVKVSRNLLQPVPSPPADRANGSDGRFKQEMRDLQDLLSKLNPMAKEFVPPSLANHASRGGAVLPNGVGMHSGFANDGVFLNGGNGNGGRRKRNGYGQGKRRMNSRTNLAQQEETIRRTVYVSDIDQQVTEEELATLFGKYGQVIDCRVCGDPNSVLRFAFIEFQDEGGARAAINLAGTVLGYYPIKVLPSKTAIAPVDEKFLPKDDDERDMCRRTIYCTNIDKKVTQTELKLFFEGICGGVHRLRLLGDYHHSTRISFVEFARAESAIHALSCSGSILGSLPIRISPSKTPVRPRAPRPPMH